MQPHINYTLDFVKQIKEVYGFVLINNVMIREIPLHNLSIIRGYNLVGEHIVTNQEDKTPKKMQTAKEHTEQFALLFIQVVCTGFYREFESEQ